MGKLGLMRLALLSPLLSSLYVNCVLRIKLFLIEVQMTKKAKKYLMNNVAY
jgi:hypothetical protein